MSAARERLLAVAIVRAFWIKPRLIARRQVALRMDAIRGSPRVLNYCWPHTGPDYSFISSS